MSESTSEHGPRDDDRIDLSEGWIEKSAEVVHSDPSPNYSPPSMALDFDTDTDSDD